MSLGSSTRLSTLKYHSEYGYLHPSRIRRGCRCTLSTVDGKNTVDGGDINMLTKRGAELIQDILAAKSPNMPAHAGYVQQISAGFIPSA